MLNSLLLRIGIILAIVAGLGGLFYLPYKTVENKTVETHNTEQVFLARQAAQGIENTFKMYGKALQYFATQPSIVHLDEKGYRMLFDFYAIHQPALASVARLDAEGKILHRISSTSTINEQVLQQSFSKLQLQQQPDRPVREFSQ